MDNEGGVLIPKTTQWLMIGTALLFDTIGIIPLLGNIMAPVIFGVFVLWFKFYGLQFMSPKRLATIGLGGFLEIFLSVLPMWTVTVFLLIKSAQIKNIVGNIVPLSKK